MEQRVDLITTEDLRVLIERLSTEKCSCLIRNGSEVRVFRERGVKDLYRLLKEESEFLSGAFVADKVVGKAAAALMILGNVKGVFANIISQSAYKLFEEESIYTEYTQKVPHIMNRTQADWCPLEKRCMMAMTAKECLPIIENFVQSLLK